MQMAEIQASGIIQCIKNNSDLCSNFKLRDVSICFLGVAVQNVQGTVASEYHSEVGCYC